MSETVRETVRACVSRATTGMLADIERETDAIMALLPHVGVENGIEKSADLIDQKLADYIKEYGSYDSTTGHTEYPGSGEEWVQDMEELAEDIRALKGSPIVQTMAQRITSTLAQPSGVVSDAEAVYQAIKHGDGEHREWLWEACQALQHCQPVPPPRGTGTAALASPVSEGEISPTPDIPRDEPTVRVQIHGGDVAGVDESIAPLVKLLNDGGVKTSASCSGHGQRPGNIALSDGRELIIARNWNEARLIDGLFPGINGEPGRGIDAAKEFICKSNEEIRAKVIEELATEMDTLAVQDGNELWYQSELIAWLRHRARSLTNGEG